MIFGRQWPRRLYKRLRRVQGQPRHCPWHGPLAIFIALSWDFALNRRVSFSGSRFGRPIIEQYFLWVASCGLGAATSWSVAVSLTSFTKFFAWHVFIAAILGIVVGSLINFILARYWVFAGSEKTDDRGMVERTRNC
jgi:hypothetical protein